MAGNKAVVSPLFHFGANLVNKFDKASHFVCCWRNLANSRNWGKVSSKDFNTTIVFFFFEKKGRLTFMVLDVWAKGFRVIGRLLVRNINNMGNIWIFSGQERWAMFLIVLSQSLNGRTKKRKTFSITPTKA